MKPKYEEIADILRQRIKNKYYPANSLLPNQTDLVKEFHVSRMTVKKAIELLSMEGLISSQRGYGTKILTHPFWEKETFPVNKYHGLSKQMEEEGKTLETKVLLFDTIFPTEFLQEKLAITASDEVYSIIRLRILEGEPYILEHTFMPCHLAPHLTVDILENSIYLFLKKDLHLSFGGAFRNVQAAKSDEYDQKYLQCQADDPVLEVEQVVYLKDGQPIEYSRSRNRYDRRSYSLLDVHPIA